MILALLFATCLVSSVQSSALDCKFVNSKGKTFDLSPLISSNPMAYQWNQTLLDTSGNMMMNPDLATKVNVMLQLQVCKNISKPIMPAACNVSAPAYMYNVDEKSCVALGKLFVATFVEAPFGDGLYLDMFYGDAATHINHYQMKVYFICKADVTMDGPTLEHIKDNYDAHIKIFTKYAC